MGRMGSTPIMPVRQPITIGTIMKIDSDGIGDGLVMWKHILRKRLNTDVLNNILQPFIVIQNTTFTKYFWIHLEKGVNTDSFKTIEVYICDSENKFVQKYNPIFATPDKLEKRMCILFQSRHLDT